MRLAKNTYLVDAILAVGALLIFLHLEGVSFSVIQMLAGLVIVMLARA